MLRTGQTDRMDGDTICSPRPPIENGGDIKTINKMSMVTFLLEVLLAKPDPFEPRYALPLQTV